MVRTEFKHTSGHELPNLNDLVAFSDIIKAKNDKRKAEMKEQFVKAKAGKIAICETDNWEDRKEFELGYYDNMVMCLSPDIGFVVTNEGLIVYAVKCTHLMNISKMIPYSNISIVWMELHEEKK